MKKFNNKGWGLSEMVGFILAFILFLLIIAFLAYSYRNGTF